MMLEPTGRGWEEVEMIGDDFDVARIADLLSDKDKL
jgi:hypothetical protein